MPADSLGSFLDYARKLPDLSRIEERVLSERAKAGDQAAKHKLVEHNIRYAVKMAKDWQGCGLSLEDLIQEACLALSQAVEGFDPDKGRFTTYATRWIYKFLWEAAYGKTDTIKRPSKITRIVVQVQEVLSKQPHASVEEIHEKILSSGAKGMGKVTMDEIRESMDHGRVVASINDENFREVSPAEVEEVASALSILDREEREALGWRYGLYGQECSLEMVAEQMSRDETLPGNFTIQEAGRLCRAAVRKLRAARYEDEDEIICEVKE